MRAQRKGSVEAESKGSAKGLDRTEPVLVEVPIALNYDRYCQIRTSQSACWIAQGDSNG
jgi:hypothetical protein